LIVHISAVLLWYRWRYSYCHLQGNPDQERFTIRSGVLTGNDTRWRSAISGSPLLERTDFGLQLDRPTYAPVSRPMAFSSQCFPATTNYIPRRFTCPQAVTHPMIQVVTWRSDD